MATAKRFSNVLGQRAQVARARRYLRRHVGDEVALGAVARAAGASMFHLARLYRAIAGETVGHALTRMRIERAADALLETPKRAITSIALEIGFRTPSSLDKAFRAALGMSPTQFRAASAAERRIRLARLATVDVPAPSFELGRPKIQTLEDLRVVYVREQGAYAEISGPLAWATLETRVAGTKLVAGQRIAASYDDPLSIASDVLRYDAAIVVGPHTEPPPGTRVAVWPGGTYAVFAYRGDYRFIADAFKQLFAQWRRWKLVKRGGPCLELYRSDPHVVPESRLLAELWVPITRS